MKPQDVRVIIPAFNESKRIAPIIAAVKAKGFPVLVVDDGSADDTAEAARKAGADVVSYKPNGGKGHALRKGIERFLAEGRCSAAVFMDSDGQHDPDDLDWFLAALDLPEGDFVFGNRMTNPKGMSPIRIVTNWTMSAILSACSGLKVPDTQCGYRGAKREALSKIRLETSRFEIESEMVLEAGRTGARVTSVPVKSVYADEKSRIRPIRDTVRFFKFLSGYRKRKRA